MFRNRDFFFFSVFALGLAYANVVGPERLTRQLYPGVAFALERLPHRPASAPAPVEKPVVWQDVALKDAPNSPPARGRKRQRRKRMPLPRGMERRMRPKPLVDGAL